MATNVVTLNVYQINQSPIPLANVQAMAFPTQGCILQDVTNSPLRSLSTGVNVYTAIQVPNTFSSTATSTLFYTNTPYATVVTAFNA